jgi:hypothetical protein
MGEAEARPPVVMCYKCHNTAHTYNRCTATSYACNAPPTIRPVWAHQQLQDHPNPHPDVDADVDVGVGPTQDLDYHSCL